MDSNTNKTEFPIDAILDFPKSFADWNGFELPLDGQTATITVTGKAVAEVIA